MAQLRITSDGTIGGTRLYDVQTGRQYLWPIKSIIWGIDAGESSGASGQIDVLLADAQVDGEGRVSMAHPTMGDVRRVKRIEFHDGGVWSDDKGMES